jgi:2-polyprenyl-3-methyl-5-hydroxy-6-metoxy-1,4-benzoquinol methylase
MNERIADFLRQCTATVYAEPRQDGHDLITARMAEQVAKHLAPGARVLDVGCGQGPALEWFNARGFEITGTTTNYQEAMELRQLGHYVIIEDMHHLTLGAEQADCVWARHVLEHSPIPFFVLTEFARMLKPGGILYVEVPSPDTACRHETNANHFSVLGKMMWASLITRDSRSCKAWTSTSRRRSGRINTSRSSLEKYEQHQRRRNQTVAT